ncbi:UNVERIFIED_CONTAM: hypothetical protein FKN15_026552 [Acipenser sinensis]
MGTVLSVSPSSRKTSYHDEGSGSLSHYPSVQSSKPLGSQKERNIKRHSMFIPALTWKRLVASTKKRGSKKSNVESGKEAFWDRCLHIINTMSAKMLRINADPHYFTQVFADLKNEGSHEDFSHTLDR